MYDPASEPNIKTGPAISSGLPARPTGETLTASDRTGASVLPSPVMALGKRPGQTALTRILNLQEPSDSAGAKSEIWRSSRDESGSQ